MLYVKAGGLSSFKTLLQKTSPIHPYAPHSTEEIQGIVQKEFSPEGFSHHQRKTEVVKCLKNENKKDAYTVGGI